MIFDAKTISSRIEKLKLQFAEHYAWGVRFDVPGLCVGHVFPVSRVWANDQPTEETLPGTATLEDSHLEVICSTHFYTGAAYIVCGEHAGYGEDQGEILMRDCEIMALIEHEDA
jgi:hypothetical protein